MLEQYQAQLEVASQWLGYLPYLLVTYVLLTLLPKSLLRMKRFADADYEANRHKYHRCYGAELCCHAQAHAQEAPVKQKQRKPVTRVYPKRQQPQAKEELHATPPSVKRSNVTKIARMFETGNSPGGARQARQVSRVLPEIRMFGASEESNESTPCASRKSSIATQLTAQLQHIEHAMQLWQELEEEQQKPQSVSDWEPRAVAVPAVPIIRRTRGTSATPTPSTASPLSSSPEPISPVRLRQPLALCLKSSMEDIFQAIARSAEEPQDCNSLSPVTCIDDILSERRFSRPLSAYSITDLLNEEQEAIYVNETTLQQQQLANS